MQAVRKDRSEHQSAFRGGFVAMLIAVPSIGFADDPRVGLASHCVRIELEDQRLACFDDAYQYAIERHDDVPSDPRASEAPAPPRTPSIIESDSSAHEDRTVSSSPASATSAQVGPEDLEKLAGPNDSAESAAVADRTYRIVAMGKLASGRFWFRLDDGSVWEQVTMRRTSLGVQDAVVLSRSILGSWRLSPVGGGQGAQVRRSS